MGTDRVTATPQSAAQGAVFTIGLRQDAVRPAARVDDTAALPGALDALGVPRRRPVIVLIGGAGKLGETDAAAAVAAIEAAVVPVAIERRAVVVDGGTDSGIMRFAGQARAKLDPSLTLVGVAAIGTVSFPGHSATRDDAAPLQPDHTHFVLVGGGEWGDESPWLPRVGAAIAEGRPVVTVLINGGDVAAQDVRRSVQAGFPVVVVRGTGRLADELAVGGGSKDELADIVRSPFVHISESARPEAVRPVIAKLLE
jgi:hypothetical protein